MINGFSKFSILKSNPVPLMASVLLLALSACVTPPGQKTGFRPAVSGSERIVINADAFKKAKILRVVFNDASDLQEYASFKTANGARAEFIYAELSPLARFHGYLELNQLIRPMVSKWRYFKNKSITFGKVKWRELSWNVGGWVQPFSYESAGQRNNCKGMTFEWDPAENDVEGRPTKTLFGYICGQRGSNGAPEMMTSLVDGLGIRGISEPGAEKLVQSGPLPAVQQQKSLKALSSGKDSEFDGGNIGFPYFFARVFSPGGDDEIIAE